MKISVVLGTYNGLPFLRQQLESFLLQTRLPDEVILSDDGSTDGSIEEAESFAAKIVFPMEIRRNPHRLGAVQNFAAGIARATGEVIVLADQDDVWQSDKLARIEQCFLRQPKTLVLFSDAQIVDEKLRPMGRSLWRRTFRTRERRQLQTGHGFELFLRRDVVTGATMAFRTQSRDWFLPIPDSDTFWHDAWIAMICEAVGVVAPLPESLILYRQHPRQQMGVPHSQSGKSKNRQGRASSHERRQERCRRLWERMIFCRDRLQNLSAKAGLPMSERIAQRLRQLTEYETHLRFRCTMPLSRRERIGGIWREWRCGHYSTWSGGWTGLWEDIR